MHWSLFVFIVGFSAQLYGNCAHLLRNVESPLFEAAAALSRFDSTFEAKEDGLHLKLSNSKAEVPDIVLTREHENSRNEKYPKSTNLEQEKAIIRMLDPSGKTRQAWERLPRQARKGHTLVEVLVVMAISAALMGLFMGGVNVARMAANKMQCTNNLKQMTLALAKYAEDHEGKLPRVTELWDTQNKLNSLLPFIENSRTVLTCPNAPPADGIQYKSMSQNFPGSPQLNYGYNYQALGLPVFSNFTPPRASLNNPNLSLSSTLVFQDNMDSNPFLYLSDTSRAYPPIMFNDPTVSSSFYYPTGHFRHPSLYGNGRNSSVQISFLDGHVESSTDKYEPNQMPAFIPAALVDFRRKNNIYSVGRNNHWWNPRWSGQDGQP